MQRLSRHLTRRQIGVGLAATAVGGLSLYAATQPAAAEVNAARTYPVTRSRRTLNCIVQPSSDLGPVDRRIFGTNLEWFNDGGGFASADLSLRKRLTELAKAQKTGVMRFPGGTLADYYNWRDGIGPPELRPARRHPTDPGTSKNDFGSPEFFALLRATGAEGLITVNAGTSTAAAAADWVRYCNAPRHPQRVADGFPAPVGVRLWEVGNELYLPGNPGDVIITQTPEQYAAKFIKYADAMRAADPSIQVIGIGTAPAHNGPGSAFPNWTETLLSRAASRLDMVAVHNAYFPLLYNENRPPVERVYPPFWASPEAVDASLTRLSEQIARHERERPIGIAVTEWGALFTLPQADPYWFDHVKTLGSGIYVARLLQVFMTQPRVALANYFKFSDRSFMGWVGFDGQPKVPYWVLRLFAESSGDRRVVTALDSPTHDTGAVGVMAPQQGVADVTAVATRDSKTGTLYVNLVNRSMTTAYPIAVTVRSSNTDFSSGTVRSIAAAEPTAHNGVDMPPELPMEARYEPYTSAKPGTIRIIDRPLSAGAPLLLAPFSVATLVLKPGGLT